MGNIILSLCFFSLSAFAAGKAAVGSKADTEGFLLGEIAAQTLEDAGVTVTRHFGIGGTGLVLGALQAGEIDFYPEYTGTITRTLLKSSREMNSIELNQALLPLGLAVSEPLGFDNSYAIAVSAEFAHTHNLVTISDLHNVAAMARVALSDEFSIRADGYLGLSKAYDLHFRQPAQSMAHSLAYAAIAQGKADVIDVYSTDAKINKLGLVVLKDDKRFFPVYAAVFLARRKFIEQAPKTWAALSKITAAISVSEMARLNGSVDVERKNISLVVSEFLGRQFAPKRDSLAQEVWNRTREHLLLVGLALLFSILLGVPLGIFAARMPSVGQVILLTSGIVQTIPSLALLCFLIPLFGIGFAPSLAALCLYSLLPVVLNTFTGLRAIDPRMREIARALGLSSWNRLCLVELPLASRNILAGIRTSLVIGIGTATLAALVGGGGYGVPIVVGLTTNDMREILVGAIPAAAMALLAHLAFQGLDRLLIPKGLRII